MYQSMIQQWVQSMTVAISFRHARSCRPIRAALCCHPSCSFSCPFPTSTPVMSAAALPHPHLPFASPSPTLPCPSPPPATHATV